MENSSSKPRGPSVSSGAITIENVCPKTWTGRPYHVGLFKEEDLIVVHEKLNVGNHAEFELSDELLFGVMHSDSLRLGHTFSAKSGMASPLFPVNLNNFPTGVLIKLTQKSAGGEYVFNTEVVDEEF